jgi:uncharacterized membrane protein YcfT
VRAVTTTIPVLRKVAMSGNGAGVPVRAARYEWIDVVRGLAVLLVVVFHAVIALHASIATTPAPVDAVNQAIAPYRMPTLMFLSGVLLSKSLAKPPREYIVGKLRHIGWPYLVWTAVTVAVLYAGSTLAGDGRFDAGRLLRFVVDPTTFTWYLAYLLLFYLLVLGVPARVRAALIPVLFVVCAVAHDNNGWSRLTYLFAFFLIGDLAMAQRRRWEVLQRDPRFLVGCAVAAVATVAVSAAGFPLRYEVPAAVGVLATIALAIPAAGRIAPSRVGRALTSVGRDSLVYYVTHWPVVTIGVHLTDAVGLDNWLAVLGFLLCAGFAVPLLITVLRRRFPVIGLLYVWPKPGGAERSHPAEDVPAVPATSSTPITEDDTRLPRP